ncbi:hypothetical protein Ocin01_12562 [Orchesella cincta]|uniref:Uncharacterized protein n=1 Tax=Orchesella cincta TaxID=48709 RepID=A0A1D2MMH1_ORCCI|nr:hypothetical protein Ocin01_12562 [Orchesella cincta]
MNANGGARRHKRTREPSHSGGSRFPSRFEDTSQNVANRQVKYRGVGFGDSSSLMSDDDVESTPPPPYSVVVQSKAVETVPLTSAPPESFSYGDGNSNTEGAEHLYEYEAWGSQLVFNNHHTPPTSGEYERPPPYYYPGPAQ